MQSEQAVRVRVASDAIDPETVQVARLEGREAISRCYELDVLLHCADINGLDEAALLDTGIAVVFERNGEPLRTIHGIVAEVRDAGVTEGQLIAYSVRIVPRAWAMSLGTMLEIYMDATVPDIVTRRLGTVSLSKSPEGSKNPTDVDLRLTNKYSAAEFVVQYKESDLAFVSRLTENLGISFFFAEQNDRDVIVFTDDNAGFDTVDPDDEPIGWGGKESGNVVYELGSVTKPIPHRYVAHDYNYRIPSVEVYGETSLKAPGPGREMIEYGVHCKTPQEAAWFSKIRAEEMRAGRKVYTGKSNDCRMRAGAKFKLGGHPRGDIELLVTSVRHHAVQASEQGNEERYVCEFTAIESTITYRPPRVTPKPRISGVLTGRIEGDGDYADVDDQGRYTVQFLFDTAERGEQQASRPIRMMQPHSGPGYGMHFPLRGGIEVALTFVDGDPDRPIIAGTVPNPTTASPVSDGNNTRNVIRTGGGNEINIDDDKSSPRIKLQTPRNNTLLQLGAPNGAEDGVLIATAGASTQTATLGIGAVTSFKTGISLVQDWRSAGDIISLAQPPGKFEKALALGELLDCAAELAGAGVEFTKSIKAGIAATDQANADLSQQNADKKQSTMSGKQRDLAAKKTAIALDTAPADSDTSAQANAKRDLKAKYDAYQAVRTRLDDSSTGELAALASARTQYFLTKRKKDIGKVSGLDDQLHTDGDAYVLAAQTVLASEEEIDGDETAPTGGEALDVYNQYATTKATSLWATLSADKQSAALTPDKLTALRNACDAYKATLPQADQSKVDDFKNAINAEKTAHDDYQAQVDDHAAKQREADDSSYQTTNSPEATGMAKASLSANAIRGGMALYSTILNLVNMFRNNKEALTNEIAWTRMVTDMKLLKMRGFSGADNPLEGETKFQDENFAMHLIGATDATGVYGLDRLFMWSPSLNIHGSDQVIIMAGKENVAVAADRAAHMDPPPNMQSNPSGALVLAKETGELKSKTVYLSGQKLDLMTTRWPIADATREQAFVLDYENDLVKLESKKSSADAKITIDTSANAKIELESKKAADEAKLTLDQGKVDGEASESLTFKVGQNVKIEATKSNSVTIDAGASGSITLKAAGFELTINKNGVTLQKAGGTKINVGPSMVTIKGGPATQLTLNSSGTTVMGKFSHPALEAMQ